MYIFANVSLCYFNQFSLVANLLCSFQEQTVYMLEGALENHILSLSRMIGGYLSYLYKAKWHYRFASHLLHSIERVQNGTVKT
jgi:hypothetical protein